MSAPPATGPGFTPETIIIEHLKGCGLKHVPDDPRWWVLPTGEPVRMDTALRWSTGVVMGHRKALLLKPWWQTSEGLMTLAGGAANIASFVGVLAGAADTLPEWARTLILAVNASLVMAMPKLNTLARTKAKELAAQEQAAGISPAKELP